MNFSSRPHGEGPWIPFARDEDGSGGGGGTTTYAGDGDGWSADLPLVDLKPGVYDLRAETVDTFGQPMSDERSVLYDPTPLAPHLLDEESELGATIQDDDELRVEVEMTDEEIRALDLALFPINWHMQRELKKVRQDTLRVMDKEGNDISLHACGPAAAASCLTWFRDRFPDLDKDPAELARKIAKAAGTDSEGTDSDRLVAAIKKILKDCGVDADDWGVSEEYDGSKVYKDMIQGLNKDGADKILWLRQRSDQDVNGDGRVDDKDETGHFVTLSSRGSRYRDVMIPPTTHIMTIEKYVDFFNPATGETEEYQIDDSKRPPELIGYEMNDHSTGNAKVGGVICVRPPAGSVRGASGDLPMGGIACGWGQQLDLPIYERIPVPGPGTFTWIRPASALPFAPGVALLGVFGEDETGCISGELYTEILLGGFAQVDFVAGPTAGKAPLTVQFVNTTTPMDSVTSWAWDFDLDGATDSSDENPVFTYADPGTYSVGLRAFNPHGSDHRVYADLIVVSDASGVEGTTSPPRATRLLPAAPNPMRVGAELRFELAQKADVRLEIYDVEGRALWRVVQSGVDPGVHTIVWDGNDGNGRAVPSGVYYLRLAVPGGAELFDTIHVVR